MEIYEELRELEYMLWRLELNLKNEELRDIRQKQSK